MDNEVLTALVDLGYEAITDLNQLNEIISTNSNENLLQFSRIVAWLTKYLSDLCKIDEKVHEIDSIDDLSTFILELNSFLKEFDSPYEQLKSLNEGNLNKDSKLTIIYYLSSELQAVTMISVHNPVKSSGRNIMSESDEASALRKLLITLGFPKPPPTITWPQILSKIELRLNELLAKLPQNYLGKPLLTAQLTNSQWNSLNKINKILNDDFKSRMEVLLKRLDVTVQSFKWADRLKDKNDEITRLYLEKRNTITSISGVDISSLLAARDDLCHQEKTCSTRLMTRSKLHKIIIPKVPDRGGRTGELQPPPPEMPAFMQRQQQQHAEPQRQQQRVQSGSGARGGGHASGYGHHDGYKQQYDNRGGQHFYDQGNYSNQGVTAYGNHRPQSDFERFQDQDYYEGPGAKRNYQDYGADQQRHGSGRGGRGRGRGGRY